MKCSPIHIRRRILGPPERLRPARALRGDLRRHIVVVARARGVAPEEHEHVVQVGEVKVDGDVVDPWLDAVDEPNDSILSEAILKMMCGRALTILCRMRS